MSTSKKSDSKTIIIAVFVVAVAVLVGLFVYNQQQKETVSVQIGDQEFSATFEN